MEKIVILTEQPKPDQDLVVWLHEQFPDCEIQIVFKGTEALGDYPADCLHFRLQRTQQGKHNANILIIDDRLGDQNRRQWRQAKPGAFG